MHHIEAVGYLKQVAWEVTEEIEDEKQRGHWFWKLYAMLYLDINNLKTLCEKCHKKVSVSQIRKASSGYGAYIKLSDVFEQYPNRWKRFLRLIRIIRSHKSLTDFME